VSYRRMSHRRVSYRRIGGWPIGGLEDTLVQLDIDGVPTSIFLDVIKNILDRGSVCHILAANGQLNVVPQTRPMMSGVCLSIFSLDLPSPSRGQNGTGRSPKMAEPLSSAAAKPEAEAPARLMMQ
jgi:hypothetical protein